MVFLVIVPHTSLRGRRGYLLILLFSEWLAHLLIEDTMHGDAKLHVRGAETTISYQLKSPRRKEIGMILYEYV